MHAYKLSCIVVLHWVLHCYLFKIFFLSGAPSPDNADLIILHAPFVRGIDEMKLVTVKSESMQITSSKIFGKKINIDEFGNSSCLWQRARGVGSIGHGQTLAQRTKPISVVYELAFAYSRITPNIIPLFGSEVLALPTPISHPPFLESWLPTVLHTDPCICPLLIK